MAARLVGVRSLLPVRDAVEGERERRDLAVAGDLAQVEIELGQPVRLTDLWLGLGLA